MKAKSAEVSFHVHLTEDRGKVDSALKELLGVEAPNSVTLYGHNGNMIVEGRAALGQPEADRLLERVLKGLGPADRARLLGQLGMHIDERGTLFIRLDKQGLVVGRLQLGERDPVRLRFKLEGKGDDAMELVRGFLE